MMAVTCARWNSDRHVLERELLAIPDRQIADVECNSRRRLRVDRRRRTGSFRRRSVGAKPAFRPWVFVITEHACRAVAREKADDRIDEENGDNQDQRAGPGLAMPVVVGRNGVGENLQRQRGDRFGQIVIPKAVAEGGEEQRRGFAGDARQRQQHAGDDALRRGAHDDVHDGFPAAMPRASAASR